MDKKVRAFLLTALALVAGATSLAAAPGELMWARQYNGPSNTRDYAAGMVVDAAGNAYVTGYSEGVGTGFDFVTIKYNPNGDTVWVARYNAIATTDDRAKAIGIDAAGNVFVTGSSGFVPESEIATIKYSPTGQRLWVMRYGGSSGAISVPTALAVDDSGNVYMTGSRKLDLSSPAKTVTIKYDGDGRPCWTMHYNAGSTDDVPTGIAVDRLRNAYICGQTQLDSFPNYLTIKYDQNGNESWVSTYDHTAHKDDFAHAIAVDAEGNVYVTGMSGRDGSFTRMDIATLMYNNEGDRQWVTRYNNGKDDVGTAIAVDRDGKACVTGYSFANSKQFDMVRIKYSHTGVSQGVQRYNSSANLDDRGKAIVVDSFGSIYSTGSSNAGTANDILVLRDSASTRPAWHARYNTSTDNDPVAIGLDAGLNVYVCASTYTSASGYNITTAKWEAGGVGIEESPVKRLPAVPVMSEIIPNPSTGPVSVSYALPRAGSVSLKLYDVSGNLIETVTEGFAAAGNHSFRLDASRFAAGIYLLKLNAEGRSSTQKLVVQ